MGDRLADHEAGHAVAAHALGYSRPGPLTVVPGRAFGGICFPGRLRRPQSRDVAGLDFPAPLLPARLRRWAESSAVFSLAGDMAVRLAAQPAAEPPVRCEPAASERIVFSGDLPVGEAEVLEQFAAADSISSDDDQVARILWLLHGRRHQVAQAHLRYLEVVTADLLGEHWRQVEAVSAELTQRGTLSGDEWRAVIEAA